jgi:hypothetical protein
LGPEDAPAKPDPIRPEPALPKEETVPESGLEDSFDWDGIGDDKDADGKATQEVPSEDKSSLSKLLPEFRALQAKVDVLIADASKTKTQNVFLL